MCIYIISYTRAHARRGRVIKRAPRAERGSGDGRLPAQPPSEPARARVITCTTLSYILSLYIYARRVRVRARRCNATRNRLRADRGGGSGDGVVVAIHTNRRRRRRRRRVQDAKPADAGGWATDRRRVDDGTERVHGGRTRALFTSL